MGRQKRFWSSWTSATRLRQTGISIVATVAPDHLEKLTDMLVDIGEDPAEVERRFHFSDLESLHYASFSVIPGAEGDSVLFFEANIDGSAKEFLDDLVRTSASVIDEIYSHCRDYPVTGPDGALPAEDVVRYLHRHDLGPGTLFVAWPGMSVDVICRDDLLRRRIQAFLDEPAQQRIRGLPADEAYHQVIAAIRAERDLTWAFDPEPKPAPARSRQLTFGMGAVVVTLVVLVRSGQARPVASVLLWSIPALLLALTGVATAAAIRLRVTERADDRADEAREEPWSMTYANWVENLSMVRHREDTRNQNHMSTVAEVKPGRFRRFMLGLVLAAVPLVARFSPPGSLAGIPSIHFARWVVTKDRKQLIFLSNFDGSWESYLNDFIDLAASGLTGVWTNSTNAVGFPRTKWLITQGAKDEPRFKAFARYGTVRTLVWYGAYPELSISNISNNHAIRVGLSQKLKGDAAAAWLRRL